MSIRSSQENVARALKEIANLDKKSAEETRKEISKSKEINRIKSSISSSTSISSLKSKEQQILRLSEDIAKIHSKKADLSKKVADKTGQLNRYRDTLASEEERERKKIIEADKRREREQLDRQRLLTRELTLQKNLNMHTESALISISSNIEYDAFISHASEDKEDFVRPLAEKLRETGYKIWYDDFELTVGDRLRRSIDRGLIKSRYGIVVLSSAFFLKDWPQYELDGLVAKEMNAAKVILPIWHKVSKDEVKSYSLSLADKVAINSSLSSLEEIVMQLAEVLGKKPNNQIK